MPEFTIPLCKTVPAHGEVKIEADTLEEACSRVRADIETNGEPGIAEGVDFTADWSRSEELSVGDVILPDGRNFSVRT